MSWKKAAPYAAFLSLTLPQIALAQAGPCSEATCIEKRAKIDAVCHSVGGLVYFEDGASMCYCRCSCLNATAAVEVSPGSYRPLSKVNVGETVLVLERNGAWIERKVTYSVSSTTFAEPVYYSIFIRLDDGKEMVATPDHLFLDGSGNLVRADRVQLDTKLRRADAGSVGIADVYWGKFEGPFHNIATGDLSEDVKQDGHLINTGGVVSGDFYLQVAQSNKPDLSVGAPQVGSRKYIERNYQGNLANAFRNVPDQIEVGTAAGRGVFTPHKPVSIPKDAIHFLPEDQDKAKEGMLVPLDSSVPYEVAEYLVLNYRSKFPDIVYHIDWTNDDVNASAWMQGGQKHVALLGGLLRHRFIQVEGAGLVLAHEIGHHHGGTPRYTDSGRTWASCEGQSDYWAAVVGQRRVWWGPHAIEQIERGGQQLYQLFQYGLVENLFAQDSASAAAGICTHPPAYCRLATYEAGKTLSDKPACAGDPGPFGLMSQPVSAIPK